MCAIPTQNNHRAPFFVTHISFEAAERQADTKPLTRLPATANGMMRLRVGVCAPSAGHEFEVKVLTKEIFPDLKLYARANGLEVRSLLDKLPPPQSPRQELPKQCGDQNTDTKTDEREEGR